MFDYLVVFGSFALTFFIGWVFLARRLLESVDVSTPVSGPPETAKSTQLSSSILPQALTAAEPSKASGGFDMRKIVIYGLFSLVVAQGGLLIELVVFEISGVLTKDLR
ncbi:hypothetical protein EC988_002757, partial [Linderina pennispora]